MTPEVKWPTLYDDTEVYGVAGWGNESARNTGLYEFCVTLPKGAELHAHEMTLLPFERYVEIVRRDAWILLEEGDRRGYLFAENNPNRPENTVLLDDALTGGLISMEELSIRNAYYKVRKEHPDFRVRIIGATGKDQRYPLDMCFETFRFFIPRSCAGIFPWRKSERSVSGRSWQAGFAKKKQTICLKYGGGHGLISAVNG